MWNRRFVQLLLIEAMLQVGAFLTRPIISGYAVSLGASVPVAGFLAGMLATAALVARPVTGAISDALSKKTLLVVSCFLFVTGAFGCAAARSVFWVGFFLALQGFAFAFKSTIVISLIPFVVSQSRVGSAVGWMGLAYTVAVAIGPAFGSWIGDMAGFAMTFAVSGCMLLAALVSTALFRVPRDDVRSGSVRGDAAVASGDACVRGAQRRFSVREYFYLPVVPLAVCAGFLMVAQGVTSSFILLVGEMRNLDNAAWYFVFYSIATFAARPLAGRASDAWGVRKVAPPAMVLAGAGMVFLALLDSMWGVALGGALMGVGQGSAYASIQAESVRGVPENMLGRSANTFFIGPDVGMGFGPVLGGAVLQSAGPAAMFLVNGAFIMLALALLLIAKIGEDGGR